jgi:hypothetical protein
MLAFAALCVGAALMFGFNQRSGFGFWSKTGGDTQSGTATEILVMRTAGGLLEVSTVRAREQFDKRFVYSVLGHDVGETVAHIRVPATYRYHIELAPEWKIVRSDSVFTVVASPVKPSLPVAFDLSKIEKDVGGSWMLLPFNSTSDLDALEREITAKLAEKAKGPVYLQLQREHARKTVTEFVEKWLVTQTQWKSGSKSTVRVFFADEPIGSFGLQAFPQLGSAAWKAVGE